MGENTERVRINFCENRRGKVDSDSRFNPDNAGRLLGTVRLLFFGIPKSPYLAVPFLPTPPVGVTSSNVKASVERGVSGVSGDAGSIES